MHGTHLTHLLGREPLLPRASDEVERQASPGKGEQHEGDAPAAVPSCVRCECAQKPVHGEAGLDEKRDGIPDVSVDVGDACRRARARSERGGQLRGRRGGGLCGLHRLHSSGAFKEDSTAWDPARKNGAANQEIYANTRTLLPPVCDVAAVEGFRRMN